MISFTNNPSCLYPTYIKAQAYLALLQATDAATEFQKIIDHAGMVWNCSTGALAHLGLARANTLESKKAKGAVAGRRPRTGSKSIQTVPRSLERC